MSRKVLIVEDEIIVADDLDWQVTKAGYEVTGIASSGEEALALVQSHRPEIVLMDFQIQGRMNGTEAAQQIRQSSSAVIIFVTAFPASLLSDSDRMQSPGICVSKPFSALQLKTALQRAEQEIQRRQKTSVQ
jgi:CheY-like chemotaxis protein